jgi:metal-dependent HD superfamily phosphatase/phosphodiesterase
MNDAILSLIIASATGVLTLCIRYAYYSKCDNIECCWCCKIHRVIMNENNENEISINVTEPKTPTNKNISESKSFRV